MQVTHSDKDRNGPGPKRAVIPVPAEKRIHIDMPLSLLYASKILNKVKHQGGMGSTYGGQGVTVIILTSFLEHTSGDGVGGSKYGHEQQQLLLQQLNNYCPQYIQKGKTKIRSFHLMISASLLEDIKRLTPHAMTFNGFAVQILSEKMVAELVKDPTLLTRHIPDY